ncbi:MAG: MATE family efflux transporter, partial [Pseudomonadota bacterium]
GDDAVAGWAIIGRILPVAFGTIFALSGAVGAILAQNYGAGLPERVRQTMRDALIFTLVYCVSVWALLALGSGVLVNLFGAEGEAADMIRLFCLLVAGTFLFNGALFVANAAFNNLGFAFYATAFNWGRATLGVIPFVWVGNHLGGAEGVLIGWGLGAVVFGVGAAIVAFRVIDKLPPAKPDTPRPSAPASPSPFTSGKGAGAGLG